MSPPSLYDITQQRGEWIAIAIMKHVWPLLGVFVLNLVSTNGSKICGAKMCKN